MIALRLTRGTEVSTLGSNGAAPTLPHLAGLADGAGPVRGVPVAGRPPGGEGVLVVGHSGTSLTSHNGLRRRGKLRTYISRLGILTPFLHRKPALLPAFDTPECSKIRQSD